MGDSYGRPAASGGKSNFELPAEVKELLDLGGTQLVSTPVTNDDGSRTVFIGSQVQKIELPALNPIAPDHVRQAETVVEPDSFRDYITQFKSATAICKASLSKNQIECVLDYHGRAREGEREDALRQPCSHVITLLCPFDGDYAKWRKMFGVPATQGALGDFLEDMMHTIKQPDGADILEAINDLRLDRSIKLKSKRDTRTGAVAFEYSDEEGAGEMALPDTIVLQVPIFQGGPVTELPVKLRYRPANGKPLFTLAVPGLDAIETAAFRSIGEHVRTDTSTPVFYVA